MLLKSERLITGSFYMLQLLSWFKGNQMKYSIPPENQNNAKDGLCRKRFKFYERNLVHDKIVVFILINICYHRCPVKICPSP
jgi:hypothetical protein